MGYAFTFEKSYDGVAVPCAFNHYQMNYIRLIMVEAGAIADDGLTAAMGGPGLEVCAQTVPAERFFSNAGWRITAQEAEFIGTRLRRVLETSIIVDLLSFYDDAPDYALVGEWVKEFAEFNERAAAQDGYYVY
ncbi:hypothetical protein ACIBF1_20210 [Spirillospora sp. NPDC050679]